MNKILTTATIIIFGTSFFTYAGNTVSRDIMALNKVRSSSESTPKSENIPPQLMEIKDREAWLGAILACKDELHLQQMEAQKTRKATSTALTLSSTSSQGGQTRISVELRAESSQPTTNLWVRRKLKNSKK